jgi:uncharacterized protein (TIGR02594 family)
MIASIAASRSALGNVRLDVATSRSLYAPDDARLPGVGKRGCHKECWMTEFVTVRLSPRYAALAIVSLTFVALATPASAHSHRGHHLHVHARVHHRHHYQPRGGGRRARSVAASSSPWDNPAFAGPAPGGFNGFAASDVVAEARRYIGGNPTGRSRLWCARFMNMVLERSGHRGTGSDMASSFARYGQRVAGPEVGAIAVMGRRGGGHVGVVSGIDANGNPIVVSGNHGHRVAEAVYPRGRIYAYVMPSS